MPAGHFGVSSWSAVIVTREWGSGQGWSGVSAPWKPQTKSRDTNRDVDPDLPAH
jgi:hypothetical protein